MKFFPSQQEPIIAQVFTRIRKDEKGDVVGYFLGLFDLSEMKKAEEELRKSQVALMNILEDTEEARRRAEEERNRTKEIINSLTDGLLLFDKDNRLSLINPQAERFFGIEEERLIGKTITEFFHLPELRSLASLLGRTIERLFREELKVTENFKLGIVAATGAIFLIYIVSFVLSFFGTSIPFIHESGLIGIGFSLVVVVIQ